MALQTPLQGTPVAITLNVSGDNTVLTPAPSAKLRVYWIGMSTSQDNPGEVLVTVKIGTRTVYRWNLGAPGVFSHRDLISGEKNESLIVNLSQAYPVQFNYTVEEVY